LIESGKMTESVTNVAGDIRACFASAEDIKYGFKDN
jgi:hypothetical protein